MNYKKILSKIAAVILIASVSTAALSGCSKNNTPDWEDTLPSTLRTTSETEVLIIPEETEPPVSLSMPEEITKVTSESESGPQLATGAGENETDLNPNRTNTSAPITSTHGSSSEAINSDTYPHSSSVGTSESSAPEDSISLYYSTSYEPFTYSEPLTRPYSYSFLNETRKKVYDSLIEAMQNHRTEIDFPKSMNVSTEDYCAVYQAIYNEENSIFYISTQMRYTTNVRSKCVTSAVIEYTYSKEEIDTMNIMIKDCADKILRKLNNSMSDYDIVKYFYDTLVKSCEYDENVLNSRDIYGCLVQKKAVCGGYAKAFSYLCDAAGIQNLTITGDADNVPHMWNMIKLGGEWYHIDVTAGYVKNAVTPYVRYDYFCVDDAVIASNRTIYETDYTYPTANSDRYNYYIYNNLTADSYEETEQLLKNEILRASAEKRGDIQIMCTGNSFENITYTLFDKSQAKVLDILNDAYADAVNKYNLDSITYNVDKTTGVIKIFLVYTN